MRRRGHRHLSPTVAARSRRRVALSSALLTILTGCVPTASTPIGTQQSPTLPQETGSKTHRAAERCLVPAANAAAAAAESGVRPGCLIRGPLARTSRAVVCAPGTRSVGIHPGFAAGRRINIRLCAVGGLRSDSPESTPGSPHYIAGAHLRAVVNARVSAAVALLAQRAAERGVPLFANSAFRSRERQRDLCRADADCRGGDYTFIAPPGHSNHQLGVAIDFAGTYATGGRSCGQGRATDPDSEVWRFLNQQASAVGFRQYAAESWHWDALGGSSRC